jgi:hypothetical protein
MSKLFKVSFALPLFIRKVFKMKQTYIVVFLFAFSLFANAQKRLTVGFLGGINISNFYNYDDNIKRKNLIRYSLGGDIGYLINNKISLRVNALYEQKGQRFSLNFGNGINVDPALTPTFTLNYLTLNLLSRGSFGYKIRFIVEGGPYFSYLLSAVGETIVNNTLTSQDIKSSYKNTNFGIGTGLGLDYQLKSNVNIVLTMRRNFGLTGITNSGNIKTNSFLGLVGVNFNL